MLASSLDLICAILTQTCPESKRTYINNVPDGFLNPSFFVQYADGRAEDLNKSWYESRAMWMIVYFPSEDEAGNPDEFEAMAVSDKLQAAFKASPSLTAPDGTVYSVLDLEGGPRDGQVYLRITLEVQYERDKPQYDLMQDVKYTQKEG